MKTLLVFTIFMFLLPQVNAETAAEKVAKIYEASIKKCEEGHDCADLLSLQDQHLNLKNAEYDEYLKTHHMAKDENNKGFGKIPTFTPENMGKDNFYQPVN